VGKRVRSRKVKLAVTIVVALIVAGGALAYYTSTGAGSGSASVGSPAELTITAGTPTSGLLYPGSTGEVDATISNPNTFPLRVNSLILDSAGIAADSGHSGCDTSALHYTTQTNGVGVYRFVAVEPGKYEVEFSHPGDRGSGRAIGFDFLGDRMHPCAKVGPASRFFAYSSLTENGEVSAWDYAPDAAWLPMHCGKPCHEIGEQ